MAQKDRTQRGLAKRIVDREYYKRRNLLRRLIYWGSVAVPAVVLLWLGIATLLRTRVYTAGPLSPPHALLASRCEVCHTSKPFAFFREVSDDSCSTCHDGAIHHGNQLKTPACGSCHVEHKGMQLTTVSDANCVHCHSALNRHTSNGETIYAANIDSFSNNGHPEFKPLLAKASETWESANPSLNCPSSRPILPQGDPGMVRLNHFAHLSKKLIDPNHPGQYVQMQCEDCHRSTSRQAWPYGTPEFQKASLIPANPLWKGNAAYMEPISYVKQCNACHRLVFDALLPKEEVPHGKLTDENGNLVDAQPAELHKWLERKYGAYLKEHPDAWRMNPVSEQRIVHMFGSGEPVAASGPERWVDYRVAQAESLLWGRRVQNCTPGAVKQTELGGVIAYRREGAGAGDRAECESTCALCHAMIAPAPPAGGNLSDNLAFPKVATVSEQQKTQLRSERHILFVGSSIPAVWLSHASFDHQAHRLVKCESCHSGAPASCQTADVLIPGKEVCQQCHHSEAARVQDAVDSHCSECHLYHDRSQEKPAASPYDIEKVADARWKQLALAGAVSLK